MKVYVHIADDVCLPVRDIIAIVNLYVPRQPEVFDTNIRSLATPREIYDISRGQPRSAVMTGYAIYICSVSVETLAHRCLTFSGNGYITLD